ncbi:hypothetical protein CHLRE_15g639379v5 [Chlamydomonas reinhardtii]|uniref:Uncharacterized protein n=1 Tax=Chlamydomonas reinhardtii TaxID=3055 RepID=A0A2K3CWP6_CHLRE|nr:uncharacterized protein CHLRE_15g639379v5 [Chlamydomonas reinhardtii]PNW72712.1 hypothetical protein CHLRE_15g639379v5 [Chlamydomonas reinhardtii]
MTDTDQESCHWRRLTPDLVRRIAACAHPNAIAGSLKLTDSETAAALRGSYNVLQLLQRSTGGNEHALSFAEAEWPGHAFVAHWDRPEPWHSLNLFRRWRLLCLAASSGHAASL